jgi:hypothetical protein
MAGRIPGMSGPRYGNVVSLKNRPRFTAQKYYFSASGTNFC